MNLLQNKSKRRTSAQKSLVHGASAEVLEFRRLMTIRTQLPIGQISVVSAPETLKTETTQDGSVFQLIKADGRLSYLSRTVDEQTETIPDVRDFRIQGNDLHVDVFGIDEPVRIALESPLDFSLRHAPSRENVRSVTHQRGVVGNVGTSEGLNSDFGSSTAAWRMLSSVGKIITDLPGNQHDKIGTGTLLSMGGNRYVLTASHVIEDLNGDVTDPSNVRFQLDLNLPNAPSRLAQGLFPWPTFNVEAIAGRTHFGGRDLALLRLGVPKYDEVDFDQLPGAILPQQLPGFSPAAGKQVLAVGYGINNNDTSGVRQFGNAWVNSTGPVQSTDGHGRGRVGQFLEYVYDPTRGVGIAAGDSGGPDFVPQYSNGRLYPVLYGVHTHGSWPETRKPSRPHAGESTYSLLLTNSVAKKISDIIEHDQRVSFQTRLNLGIIVDRSGDGGLNGSYGEWSVNVTINGTKQRLYGTKKAGQSWYFVRGQSVSPKGTYTISLDGEEKDGFLNPNDDIKRGNWSITIPKWVSQSEASPWTQLSGSVSAKKTAYRFVAQLWRAPVSRSVSGSVFTASSGSRGLSVNLPQVARNLDHAHQFESIIAAPITGSLSGEKWFQSKTGNDYFITADGSLTQLHDHDDGKSAELIAVLSEDYYENPELLVNPMVNAPAKPDELQVNVDGEATIPASVTIDAGQSTSAPFTITGVDDAIVDSTQTITITDSAANHKDGSNNVDVTDEDTSPQNPGNVDGDGDFDANDSFLTHLVKLSGNDSQINQAKGTSSLTLEGIRSNIGNLDVAGDVDGDGDFDANDSFLIHLVKLSGNDAQIDQAKGNSTLTAALIRASVNNLGSDSRTASRTRTMRSEITNAAIASHRTTSLLPKDDAVNVIVPVVSEDAEVRDAHAEAAVWSTFRNWIDTL